MVIHPNRKCHGAKLDDWSKVGKLNYGQTGADITKVVFANFSGKKKKELNKKNRVGLQSTLSVNDHL